MLKSVFLRAVNNQIPKSIVLRNSVRGMSEFSNEDEFLKSTNMDTERKGKEKCLNSVTLLGRVGGDPQLRGTSGQAVTFSLATNERWLNKTSDVWETRTSWHNIAVFKDGMRQSIYDNVGKGHRVLVQGRLNYGQIEDQAGIVRKTTTIIADDVIRLASPVGGGYRDN